MLKLIRKDYQTYGHMLFFQVLFIVGFMTMGIYDHKANLAFLGMLMYPAVIPTTILISDYSYFTLCCALPCQRKSYVLSKYAAGFSMSLLLVSAGMLYGYTITTLVWTDSMNMSGLFTMQGMTLLMIPIIAINSITFPIFFKFSKEKGFHVLIIVFVIMLICLLLVLVGLEESLVNNLEYTRADIFPVLMSYIVRYIENIGTNTFIIQLLGGSAALLGASIILSIGIFTRKDIGG